MADKRDGKADDSAEKAYAAAAEAAAAKSDPVSSEEEALVAFPPKASRKGKSSAPVKASAPAPQADTVEAVPAPAPKPARPAARKAAVQKPAAKKAAVKKPAAKKVVAEKTGPSKVARVASPAPKVTAVEDKKTSVFPKIPTIAQLKDKIMATTKTPDFTAGIQDVIADAQAKAKEAFEKSTSAFGDVNDFTKGNVEALVESGKILASGLQDMGTTMAAEGRSVFETLTADMKELSTVKSPADFFKLQGEIARRNFDTAVATGSKHSEALLKLASDVVAPLSGRVSVAVEKVRKAA